MKKVPREVPKAFKKWLDRYGWPNDIDRIIRADLVRHIAYRAYRKGLREGRKWGREV